MKLLPWLVSLLVHGLIFFLGGVRFRQTMVEVASPHKGMEVRLTAAFNQSTLLKPLSSPSIPTFTAPSCAYQQLAAVASSSSLSPSQRVLHSLPKNLSNQKNKGVSEHARKNAVKEPSASGAAIMERAPDYLCNPAPVYPSAAQEQRQQGLVILDVIVSADGRPEGVKIFSGSGYYLLDEAAKQAVQNYRFRPALVNEMKVRSHVRVPIRFRLDE